MANPLIFPANLQWMGLAKEVTYGTAVSAPTIWVPVMAPKHVIHITQLDDKSYQGNMAELQNRVAGVRYDELTYDTFPMLDSAFPHYGGILGGVDTKTGVSDPVTHSTSLLNTGQAQPNSYTLFLFNGAEAWQIPGAQLSQVEIETKVASDLAKTTATWMGLPATKMAVAPTNTPTTLVPEPSWNTTLTIGGTVTSNYSDFKLTFKRNVEAVFAASGSQVPYVIFVGALTVEGDMTAVYQGHGATVSDLANYIANTQPIIVAKVAPAGDATHFVQWTLSKAAYDTDGAAVSDSGKYMEIAVKFSGVANTTDVIGSNGGKSPVQFEVLNAVTTAY